MMVAKKGLGFLGALGIIGASVIGLALVIVVAGLVFKPQPQIIVPQVRTVPVQVQSQPVVVPQVRTVPVQVQQVQSVVVPAPHSVRMVNISFLPPPYYHPDYRYYPRYYTYYPDYRYYPRRVPHRPHKPPPHYVPSRPPGVRTR